MIGTHPPASTHEKIFLVGSPNVGKSALFNNLTGHYVTVSNYPGTTVDVFKGKMKIGRHHTFEVVDTPGMYSLKPITAEEDVTREILLREIPDVVVHVVDAKNLDRMLPLTLQLIELGLPVILVLNLYDELLARGMRFDIAHLEHDLGIPVVETVAVSGMGVNNLRSRIVEVTEGRYKFNTVERKYPEEVEKRIDAVCEMLRKEYKMAKRPLALLALQQDDSILKMIGQEADYPRIREALGNGSSNQIAYQLSVHRRGLAKEIIDEHLVIERRNKRQIWKEKLSDLMVHPVWGLPILGLVLYFGLYKFVGEFGAGTVVDVIENGIFMQYINPWVDAFFGSLFGSGWTFKLFAGEYGMITLGVRYAFAIILPIVATFFIMFSMIEDSGYLPRLAMLVDRVFKAFGLSGRAVIPITLGFGCDTMATVVTRTLESTKERIIATFLLSLAIPCSAQLGVLLGLLANKPVMILIWAVTIFAVFGFAGALAKRLVRGEDTAFFMELPPLRMPVPINVFVKTYARMVWYFKEVLPIFIFASAMIWFGHLTGIFSVLVRWMAYPVQWAGMPAGASPAFLYGFFRRDFGAAGLFDMVADGTLAGNSLLISSVVLTLFIPCVAQFVVVWKERGKAMAVGMAAFIFPFSFTVGFLLNSILNVLRIQL